MRFLAVLAATVGIASFVVACGDSSDEESVDAGVSPLEEIFGFGGSAREQQQRAEEQNRAMELAIEQCMADQGFEYTPRTGDSGFVVDGLAGEDLDDTDYAAQYGFGITTIGFDDEPGLVEVEEDPNFARMQEMPEAQRTAYEDALYGGGDSTGEPTGCQATAADEIFGGFEIFDSLTPAFADMERRFNADRRIVLINNEFAECIAGHGYEFSGPHEMQEAAFALLDEVFGSSDYATLPLQEELDTMSDEEREASFSGPAYDEESLAAAQAEERAMAVAALDCGVSPRTGVSPEILAIRFEYEQSLIDENREVFEAFRARDR